MSEETRLEQKLKEFIVERLFLEVDPNDIGDEDMLMDTLDVDSIKIFEIVIGLEDEFGIVIEEDEFDIEMFKSVRSIADTIRAKQGSS